MTVTSRPHAIATSELPSTGAEAEMASPSVTIIVPTFKERDNLPHLLDRIRKVREALSLDLDVLIMDDNSADGTEEFIATYGEPWVQLVIRKENPGLSPAVLEGLQLATGDVLCCMDADLSHPPESIADMLVKLDEGADFVVGSRYVSGGTTSDDWGVLRWLNSRAATLLARPLTDVKDPMAGFFLLRRTTFERGRSLNPIGYKIGLELIVRCLCERVVEVPIHFEDRVYGESKLSLKQQLLYIQHLRRLYMFKYGAWSQLTQFLAIGAMGTIVNLSVLTLLLNLGLTTSVALASAIFMAMCFNFVLSRRFSFSNARHLAWPTQFVSFIAASSVGALINYGSTVAVLRFVGALQPQVAALVGIAAGTGFNFVASRYVVFRASHIRLPRRTRRG
jgi:dolichol-phosphate mannosyltransferase